MEGPALAHPSSAPTSATIHSNNNSTMTNNESPIDLLRDSLTPHSLQNPPAAPLLTTTTTTTTTTVDLSSMTSQEAATHLFSNSEILAPMVRASTTPLRILALSHGASLAYTEELIDRSITPTQRILNTALGTIDYRHPKEKYSAKVRKRMEMDKDYTDGKDGAIVLRIDPARERGRLIYQMGTGEGKLALEAAMTVLADVDGIDVNMGCPKKFSVGGGMGSALLSDPKRACDILATLSRNLPNKPISAKIRLLHPTDPRPTIQFAKSLIQAGANAIAIHGRIVGDESHVNARWETLVEVVQQLKQTESVPIVVNGDLYTREDIREIKRRSGCDGVMLGRPALYNISLFNRGDEDEHCNLQQHQNQQQHDDNQQQQQQQMPLSQFQTKHHTGQYGYTSPLLQPRLSIVQEYISHCVRYRAHPKNAKYVICEMMNARRAPTERAPFLNMEFPGGQTIKSICKCRNLDDLVKVWDVNLMNYGGGGEIVTGAVSNCDSGDDGRTMGSDDNKNSINNNNNNAGGEVLADLHNYDDRYFLDADKFRKERSDAVDAALSSGGVNSQRKDTQPLLSLQSSREREDEKKVDDGTDSEHIVKRPKL